MWLAGVLVVDNRVSAVRLASRSSSRVLRLPSAARPAHDAVCRATQPPDALQ